jgi:hypothetical protein
MQRCTMPGVLYFEGDDGMEAGAHCGEAGARRRRRREGTVGLLGLHGRVLVVPTSFQRTAWTATRSTELQTNLTVSASPSAPGNDGN